MEAYENMTQIYQKATIVLQEHTWCLSMWDILSLLSASVPNVFAGVEFGGAYGKWKGGKFILVDK